MLLNVPSNDPFATPIFMATTRDFIVQNQNECKNVKICQSTTPKAVLKYGRGRRSDWLIFMFPVGKDLGGGKPGTSLWALYMPITCCKTGLYLSYTTLCQLMLCCILA